MSQNQTAILSEPEQQASFPPGLHNAFLFSGFNALSYPLVLSSPMVLYAKTLGASATVLGIIAGMMPLLVIFQIPAANYIARVGFKRVPNGAIKMPGPADPARILAAELVEGALQGVSGVVQPDWDTQKENQ